MDRALVDRNSADPLHLQVRQSLLEEIARGGFQPGHRLPSERELCRRFQVSRVTLRRALSGLVGDGVLVASAGRGWFVSSPEVGEPPNALLSFTRMAASRGLIPSSRLVDRQVRPATLDEAEALAIAPGASLFDLERVRLLDGMPVALDRSRVPLARAPGLERAALSSASLYQVLEDHGVVPTRADYCVQAVSADERHAEALGLAPGSPVLVADQRTFDQEGRPIELGRIAYRGDRYRFQATLLRPPTLLPSPTEPAGAGPEGVGGTGSEG